jgi:adenine-specific DNA-methyltransferase
VDYILVYAKNIDELANFREPISENVIEKVYTKIASSGPKIGEKYRTMGLYQAMLDKRANQRFWIECPDGTLAIPPGNSFPSDLKEGAQITPDDGDGVWRWTYGRYKDEKAKDNIEFLRSETTSLVQPTGQPSAWNINYKIWLQDRLDDGQLPGNILTKFESRHSSSELKKLDIPFDFAKPSNLIAFLAGIAGIANDDIVIDFFAGSGSTAHGILRLAQETGIKGRFICVQLPELTLDDSSERKAGYKTIAEIAKERIRRLALSVKQIENSNSEAPSLVLEESSAIIDLGFRAFKLAPSNFKRWDGDAAAESVDALAQQLEANLDHLADHATEESILFEILLKAGFELTCPVEKLELAGHPVYAVEDGALLLCLADRIDSALIDAVAERHPVQFICLDRALHGDDALKVNALETFRACQPEIQFRTV